MPIIHKVKQIAIKASRWSAPLLFITIALAPMQALASSKTYAVTCAGSNVQIKSGVLECSVAPARPTVEGIGAAKKPYPSGAGVATVTVNCGRSSSVDPRVSGAATFRCKNGSSPTINNLNQVQKAGASPAPTPLPPISPGCNISGCDLVATYVQPLVNLLSGIVGIIVVISLIMGGIEYSTSEGDPQKSSKAKRRITNTLFALICYFFLYAFLQFLIPNGVFH